MSYFEDQEEAWIANNCKGSIEDYNPYTDGEGYEPLDGSQDNTPKRPPPREPKLNGFEVRQLTPYHYRVEGRLDLYPKRRRWHDIKTNTRGSYDNAQKIAEQVLSKPKP